MLVAGTGVAQEGGQRTPATDAVVNPLAGAAAVAAGKTMYRQTCQACHGAEARGDRGPALDTGNFRHGGTDADLFHTLQTGVPGTLMPSFSALPANSLWQVIAYLRSLSGPGSGNEVAPGDAAAGETIFWGKGGCGACHEVNGRGSGLGPDLSAAGQSSAASLRAKILDPNAPPPRRRFFQIPVAVVVKTRSGEEVRGLVRAEDSFTLIMAGMDGKLHRFDKKDLAEERVLAHSLMPADTGKTLSGGELENLVAYLKSLKQRDLSQTAEASLTGGLAYDRLRNAAAEPQNWLTYWGNYGGAHFSALRQIGPENVTGLRAAWAVQMPGSSTLEATPLVVDGTMYTTGQPGQVFAIDARTGLTIWRYERAQKVVNPYQINVVNRGVAMLGNRLFLGTMDAALVALDARTGRVLWETQVADTMQGYTINEAPLAIQGKVIVGVAGGEYGIRGFVDAYDAVTGKRLWRSYTIPAPGEPGSETWSGDSWKHGGGPTWLTGSYDAELNLLYWAVGNAGPDLNGDVRKGDNLYSCSVVALDADTGKLRWYYQFTPNDTHDWDATEDLVLADARVDGKERKLLLQADRNGMFYALDRTDGTFLFAKPFVRVTWNRGYGKDGRPLLVEGWRASPEGSVVYPAAGGGTNWQNPSYDAASSTLYVTAHDGATKYRIEPPTYEAGRQYWGGANTWITGEHDENDVLAIDTTNGTVRWKFPIPRMSFGAGVLATGSGLVFAGTGDGSLMALDGKSGKPLWHFKTGGRMNAAPMSYAVNGQQYIAVSAGNVLYSFALPR
ncbi:MAG: PQQ-dependent dehydrogenase, methanol/ethanol family [Acidobacteriota bacterium]